GAFSRSAGAARQARRRARPQADCRATGRRPQHPDLRRARPAAVCQPRRGTNADRCRPVPGGGEMNRLAWAIRRELWENRSIYVGPLAVAGVILVGFALALQI